MTTGRHNVTRPLALVRDIADTPLAAKKRGRFVERPQTFVSSIDDWDHQTGDHGRPGRSEK